MSHAVNYLSMLISKYDSFDDCRKALLFHRLYLSFEKSIETYLVQKSLNTERSKYYHRNLVDAARLHLGLSQNIFAVIDELRRFRHLFVNNHTVYRFDAQKLDDIFNLIRCNSLELEYILADISQ